jgi:hypothetical protein
MPAIVQPTAIEWLIIGVGILVVLALFRYR